MKPVRTQKVYKIRNAEGLFSTGGTTPRWTKQGKTWTALNHLSAHLSLLRTEREVALSRADDPRVADTFLRSWSLRLRDPRIDPYVGCAVVEYTVQPTKETSLVEGKMA